jgi:outer membrane receptor protein involved in Fe transport
VINSGTILLGGLPQLRDIYNFNGNPAYSQASLMQFAATGNPALLKAQTFGEFKPENSASYEVGYKGVIGKKLLIDIYGYMSDFENFITNVNVVQSTTGSVAGLANANTRRVFVVATNAPGRVKTRGYGVSVDYLLPKNFSVAANVYSDEMYQKPADASFVTFYNTPKYRTNISVSNSGFGTDKRYGFSAIYRWQEAFDYEGTFAVGKVPAFGTVDAMISYKYPKIKSMVKLGGTNLMNKYYVNGFGNAQVGALYYVAFSYNVF